MKQLQESVAELLNMPKDIAMNLPKLTLIGNRELTVEGFRGLLEFEIHTVRASLGTQILTVKGKMLDISRIGIDQIHIKGEIISVEFQ